MAASPALIKELRERTGAGMMDCKRALEENNNDVSKAIDFLREKGLAAAAKKAGRIAAEGVCQVLVSEDGKKGVVVEVNCETDFAANGEAFKEYVNQVAAQALASSTNDINAFLEEKWSLDPTLTVKQALSTKIATIGENINIRRFEKFEKSTPGMFSTYVHGGGKIAVLLDVECDTVNDQVKEAGKNACLQIAALIPKFIHSGEIPQDFLEKEKSILTAAALNENKESENPKPENVLENIIKGRFNKYLKEICLVDQEYVKDNSMTVGQYIDGVSKEVGSKITLSRFICFERGEGIEKKEENFAEEVAKVTGNL